MSGSVISETKPPRDDEIEVSLFGPGFGESMALHLGNGDWMVVDSCRDLGGDGDNAVLSYLENLGVNPTTAVKLIVITHWDNDHIGGISDVIQACGEAKVAITSAFEQDEFLSAIAPWVASPGAEAQGLRELRLMGKSLKKLRPIPASENKVLYERGGGSPCQVRALSPSDASILACVARLQKFPKEAWRGRFPKLEGNDCSVVLSVESGGRRILLGADLEVRACRDYGWLAVIDAHLAASRERYSLVKIAHHGSPNGDHPEIWEHLLVANPHSLVAPFVNGSVKRPDPSDVARIMGQTDKAWITARPKGRKLNRYDRAVQKQMLEKARIIEEIPRGFGHVRLRGSLGEEPSSWSVELFGGAVELSHTHS